MDKVMPRSSSTGRDNSFDVYMKTKQVSLTRGTDKIRQLGITSLGANAVIASEASNPAFLNDKQSWIASSLRSSQ